MLVKDIKPNESWGTDLFLDPDPEFIIRRRIELPLQTACRTFFEKGIKTVMSSANANNIVIPPEMPVEKEDVYKSPTEYTIIDKKPSFEDAGKGYAWIMLDFDSLSDENKDFLFALESKKDENGVNVGSKGVWFVQPFVMGNLDYFIRTGFYSKEKLREILSEEEIPQDAEYDPRLAEFDKRRILLSYNNRYPANTVILRYPINEETTAEEVSEYFTLLAKSFKEQKRKELTEEEKEEMREFRKKLEEERMDFDINLD